MWIAKSIMFDNGSAVYTLIVSTEGMSYGRMGFVRVGVGGGGILHSMADMQKLLYRFGRHQLSVENPTD